MDESTKKSWRKAVGKHIQELRKSAGFTSAKSFAEEIGFNPNTYTQYEQGISGFNCEQAWIMADALKCSIDELVGRQWPLESKAVDEDADRFLDRYSALPETNREAVRDMLTVQENKLAEKTEPIPGDPRREEQSA